MTKRTRLTLISAGAALALALSPSTRLLAQSTLDIFKGETGPQSGVALMPWGSGEAQADAANVYVGSHSVKLTTHGSYQGARIVLQNPVDLKAYSSDPAAFLQFVILVPNTDTGSNRYMGGFPGPPGGRGGMLGGPGGEGGRGGYGGYGSGSGNVKMLKPKPLSSLRVVLVTDDGRQIETSLDTTNAHPEENGWGSIAIPVDTIKGMKDGDVRIKEVRVFGNSPSIVYLGEIRVIHDETPINVESLVDQTVARNDIVTFNASADAGPVPLTYEWTFIGPVPEGQKPSLTNLPADATGKTVRHQFRKSGDYVVALTVKDKFGVKKPATTSCSIHVTL